MGAIEGVIKFPSVAVRFYSVHLGSLASEERLVQVRQLLASHHSNQIEGGMWTGTHFGGRGIDWSCVKHLDKTLPDGAQALCGF